MQKIQIGNLKKKIEKCLTHGQTEHNLLFLARKKNATLSIYTRHSATWKSGESTGQLSSWLFKHLHVQSVDLIPTLPVHSQILT